MARLGSVIGGVLAELARARAVSDQLTRELVEEYQGDPILASMTVPRVTLGAANLTLRYSVDDVVDNLPDEPEPQAVVDAWQAKGADKAVDRVLADFSLNKADSVQLKAALADNRAVLGKLPVARVKTIANGNAAGTAKVMAAPLSRRWANVPPALQKKLGGKANFDKVVVAGVEKQLTGFVDREGSRQIIKSALKSRINVSVQRDKLANADPATLHEIQLTLNGDDLELLVGGGESDGD